MADKDIQIIASSPKGIVVEPVAASERLITNGDFNVLKLALHQLSAQALNFANMYINDASVRYNYCYKINKMAEEILSDVESGKATAKEGAEFANQLRNHIMEEARIQSSTIGKAIAQKKKVTGRTIEELINNKTAKTFPGKTFEQLTSNEKQTIYKSIISSSGRSDPKFTTKIPKWKLLGKGCLLFTIGITTYNIWTSENKIEAGLKDGIALGGGFLGGAIAGSVSGLVCGPGAPVCSTVLFVVGGIIGTLAAQGATTIAEDEIVEFSEWLGEYVE